MSKTHNFGLDVLRKELILAGKYVIEPNETETALTFSVYVSKTDTYVGEVVCNEHMTYVELYSDSLDLINGSTDIVFYITSWFIHFTNVNTIRLPYVKLPVSQQILLEDIGYFRTNTYGYLERKISRFRVSDESRIKNANIWMRHIWSD